MLCPKCETDHAHRSHRAGITEHLIGIVGYQPYRCHKCDHRFLNFRYSHRGGDGSGDEREVAATQGSLRRRRRRRELLLYGSALTVFVVILYFLTREPSIGN